MKESFDLRCGTYFGGIDLFHGVPVLTEFLGVTYGDLEKDGTCLHFKTKTGKEYVINIVPLE